MLKQLYMSATLVFHMAVENSFIALSTFRSSLISPGVTTADGATCVIWHRFYTRHNLTEFMSRPDFRPKQSYMCKANMHQGIQTLLLNLWFSNFFWHTWPQKLKRVKAMDGIKHSHSFRLKKKKDAIAEVLQTCILSDGHQMALAGVAKRTSCCIQVYGKTKESVTHLGSCLIKNYVCL